LHLQFEAGACSGEHVRRTHRGFQCHQSHASGASRATDSAADRVDQNLYPKIATGCVRSSMLNTEGGTDPEEQNWVAQTDRGTTGGNVWLGSTTQCSQCHNHKYDPF
jgi:hypothetical protein